MRTILFITVLILVSACKKTDTSPKVEPISQERLQGHWEQKGPYNPNNNGPNVYKFYINGDSFQMAASQFSDALTEDCWFTNWTNYSAGKISIKNDSLLFNGIYTDSTFQELKTSKCQERIHMGSYSSGYKAQFINDSLHILSTGPNVIHERAILFKK